MSEKKFGGLLLNLVVISFAVMFLFGDGMWVSLSTHRWFRMAVFPLAQRARFFVISLVYTVLPLIILLGIVFAIWRYRSLFPVFGIFAYGLFMQEKSLYLIWYDFTHGTHYFSGSVVVVLALRVLLVGLSLAILYLLKRPTKYSLWSLPFVILPYMGSAIFIISATLDYFQIDFQLYPEFVITGLAFYLLAEHSHMVFSCCFPEDEAYHVVVAGVIFLLALGLTGVVWLRWRYSLPFSVGVITSIMSIVALYGAYKYGYFRPNYLWHVFFIWGLFVLSIQWQYWKRLPICSVVAVLSLLLLEMGLFPQGGGIVFVGILFLLGYINSYLFEKQPSVSYAIT